MRIQTRPVYLNLFRIHLPLAGWVSILHRVSGVLLFLAFPVGVGAISVSLSSETGFQWIAEWLSHPLIKIALLVLIWSFAHHFLAGLRHLALDVHWGVGQVQARRSSGWVMILAAGLTISIAWRLFA